MNPIPGIAKSRIDSNQFYTFYIYSLLGLLKKTNWEYNGTEWYFSNFNLIKHCHENDKIILILVEPT